MIQGAGKERSRWAVASAVHGVVTLDARGLIRGWNPSARRILGCTAQEALGRRFDTLFPSLGRAVRSVARRSGTARRIVYREGRARRSDGRTADVALTIVPSTETEGGRLVLIRDITEGRAAERRVRDALSVLEEAQELGELATWSWDLVRDEVTWSKELHRMLGIDRSVRRATYRRMLARVHPDDRPRFAAAVKESILEGAPLDVRHRLLGAGARWLCVRSSARLIEGGEPGETRLVGTCRVVPFRRSGRSVAARVRRIAAGWRRRVFFLAEAALALFGSSDIREALRQVCRAAAPRVADRCTVDLLDPEGRVLRTSDPDAPPRSLEALPEGPLRRVLGGGEYEWHSRLSPASLRSVLPDLRDHDLEGRTATSFLVLPIRTPAGTAGAFSLVQAESRRRIDAADLTAFQYLARMAGQAVEHARLREGALAQERQIRELNRELETRVERRTAELQEALRDLDAYASAVAHDLRAPLRALRSFSEMLLEECGERLDERGKDYAGRICSACVRLDALVMDLLTYSRVSRRDLELGPLAVDGVVDEVLRAMEEEIRQAGAEVCVEAPLGRVRGNRVVLAQVLRNLVSNAIRYQAPGARPRVRFLGERRDARLRIWVEDNGVGIPAEHQERIFRPFERGTAGASISGTGLGLSIVRRGVERMQGEVGVDSAPGRGSRFWVELFAA